MVSVKNTLTFKGDDPHSIFLAGPSSRENVMITPWRKEAVTYLKKKYDETEKHYNVFVPEPFQNNYVYQLEWEEKHLQEAACIVFWVPRDLEKLPGFTTNIEFGHWMFHPSRKPIVLGYPEGAPKMRYLHHKARKYKIPVFHTLEETLDKAIELIQ